MEDGTTEIHGTLILESPGKIFWWTASVVSIVASAAGAIIGISHANPQEVEKAHFLEHEKIILLIIFFAGLFGVPGALMGWSSARLKGLCFGGTAFALGGALAIALGVYGARVFLAVTYWLDGGTGVLSAGLGGGFAGLGLGFTICATIWSYVRRRRDSWL